MPPYKVITSQKGGTNKTVISQIAQCPNQSPIQWVQWDLSQEVKQLEHEADHSTIYEPLNNSNALTFPKVITHIY